MSAKKEELMELYRLMLLIRRFEEKVAELYSYGKLAGTTHLYIGEEAVAVGVCSVLRKDDYLTSTHRGHGHCIAKGARLDKMVAEVMGRATGYCKGKGGSMHIADISVGNLGANGIVGGGLTIAAGAGIATQLRRTDQVTVCFFGDGAVNLGEFHESLNLAGLWKLPVVYVCENNLYGMSMHTVRATAGGNIAARASAYAMPGVSVDGMDVLAVREAAEEAVQRARKGEGPTLVECQTYRFLGHSRSDACPYRTKEEEIEWKNKCPIKVFQKKLVEEGIATDNELKEIEEGIMREIEEAVRFSEESPYPTAADLLTDIYA